MDLALITAPARVAKHAIHWFREALFPVFCFGCEQEGSWLCGECEKLRPTYPIQRCIFCAEVSAFGKTCNSCARTHALEGVTVLGRYREWIWRNLIRTWKYSSARDLDKIIENIVAHADFAPLLTATKSSCLVPVPLARRRQNDRGFNQAEVIGIMIAKLTNTPVVHGLARTRHTAPQSEVSAEERAVNVADAFQATEAVRGQDCLLIDDIVTSGATLEEAAKTLKRAGAKSVWALTLVRSDLVD